MIVVHGKKIHKMLRTSSAIRHLKQNTTRKCKTVMTTTRVEQIEMYSNKRK